MEQFWASSNVEPRILAFTIISWCTLPYTFLYQATLHFLASPKSLVILFALTRKNGFTSKMILSMCLWNWCGEAEDIAKRDPLGSSGCAWPVAKIFAYSPTLLHGDAALNAYFAAGIDHTRNLEAVIMKQARRGLWTFKSALPQWT